MLIVLTGQRLGGAHASDVRRDRSDRQVPGREGPARSVGDLSAGEAGLTNMCICRWSRDHYCMSIILFIEARIHDCGI
jgi:hypothetical protein